MRRSSARLLRAAAVVCDDLLDAYVSLWSALRFARGPGQYVERFPAYEAEGEGFEPSMDLIGP